MTPVDPVPVDPASVEPGSLEPVLVDQRPFIRRVLIVVGLVGLIAILLVILGLAWTAMLTLFGGALIGVLIDGVTHRVVKWTRMPRTLALVLLLGGGLGLTVAAGFWLGPALVAQLEGLREQVTIAWVDLQAWMQLQAWGPRALADLEQVDLTALLSPRFGGWLTTTVGTLASLLLVAVFGIYFAIDPKLYVRGLVRLFPHEQRRPARELLAAIARALRSWFVGRALSMVVIGVTTAIGLAIVRVPLAIPLGVLAGLLSFVPNIGPISSAIPAILVGFAVSPQTALWVLLVCVIVQLLESWAITPIIEQRVVSLPPVLLLAFQMLMGLSAGVIGLFMATPLLVTIVVMVQALYVRDTLEDDVELIGEPPVHKSARPAPQAARIEPEEVEPG